MPLNRTLDDKEYFELTHHEDGVINHRLTWLLAGQPLLFLAYVTAAGNASQKAPGAGTGPMEAALKWIPYVGGGMAFAVLLGVLGAVLATKRLTNLRGTHEGAGVSFTTTFLGLVPPIAIPVLLTIAWWMMR